jgi:hypothetical protein
MFSRGKKYFSSFEKFIQFQYGLRRRILELYYKWFRIEIIRHINQFSKEKIDKKEFSKQISFILHLPTDIAINESEKVATIRQANKTVNGIYNLLGSGDVVLNSLNWHYDFKSGFQWPPGKFYRKYLQEGIDSNSDVKVPRELSRCHHLLNLGLAFKLTNNEKFAEICISQIENWIDENPLMYSINWGCTMDVAIRAVNWMWTLALISNSKGLDNQTVERIKVSLYQHGWFIFRNPEKELFNNHNHYLADLAGQIHLGLIFSNFEEPRKWLNNGKKELFREIRMQILPSGMSYERSTNYNRLVLELVLIPVLLLKNNSHEIPQDIWYRLEKMFEFIMYSLKPDGNSPIIGDQDNGRLLPFGVEEINNFRYLLSLGALLFNRSDFKYHGDGFNIYCSLLAGERVSEKWNKIPDIPSFLESRAFPDSGLYIMRKNNNYLLFNASGKGLYPELESGTHTHSDLFSFELFTQGKSFFIDPGSYLYTADADQRMLFRSTKMHNTVTIDSESQNNIRREELWDFSRDAVPTVLTWISNNNQDHVTAIHNGYTRLLEPVLHERTIIFDKIKEKWVIIDSFTGKGYHKIEWFFHFDFGIDFKMSGNTAETCCEDNKNIILTFEQKSELSLRKEKSFISKSYGNREDGYVLVALMNDTFPLSLKIEIRTLN